jgi:hypothetical protein
MVTKFSVNLYLRTRQHFLCSVKSTVHTYLQACLYIPVCFGLSFLFIYLFISSPWIGIAHVIQEVQVKMLCFFAGR